MYAVIKTGGKQYRVEEGQRLDVERLGRTTAVVLALLGWAVVGRAVLIAARVARIALDGVVHVRGWDGGRGVVGAVVARRAGGSGQQERGQEGPGHHTASTHGDLR